MGVRIKDMPENNQRELSQKSELSDRAFAAGLDDSRTEEEVVAAESAKKNKGA